MKIISFLVFLAICAAVALAGCTDETSPAEQEALLSGAVSGVNAELLELKEAVEGNAESLGTGSLSGESAEQTLKNTLLEFPWAESSLVISGEGIVLTAVPANQENLVGMDLSSQSPVISANSKKVPVVSEVFLMQEGFWGISQSAPVFSGDGDYLGYTDITYMPEELIGRVIMPLLKDTPYDAWVVQTDGLVIFDTTAEEIGKNLFTDPAYQSLGLREVFSRIVTEPSGNAVYSFWDRDWGRYVGKKAVWATAGIDGAEWRIVITKAAEEVVTAETTATPGIITPMALGELEDFVGGAVIHAVNNGRDAALDEFNNPDGQFVSGDLYIFAYDMNGNVLALPFQKGLIGQNRREVTDTNGVAYIDGLIEMAGTGGGSLYYVYPNPAKNYEEQLKLSYVLPVDGTWFVGSGIYVPGLGTGFDEADKDRLMERVKSARDYAQVHGMDSACEAFNDLSGDFANGGEYIFAYDLEGNTLALPYQPELVGTNRLGFEDRYGVKAVQWEINAAKSGGGFVYVTYTNPDTGEEGLKLCYVAPVDGTWFVGSGIYTADT